MENLSPHQGKINSSLSLDRVARNRLLQVFWAIAFLLIAYQFFFTSANFLSICGAVLITVAALVPIYLWVSGKALGLPIFPLFSMTFIWTYSLPLVNKTEAINQYSPENHLSAGLIISASLALSTFIWYLFVNRTPPLPVKYVMLESGKGERFLLLSLGLGVIFNISTLGGWFNWDDGTSEQIRYAIWAITALSTCAFGYQFVNGDLTNELSQSLLFLCVISVFGAFYFGDGGVFTLIRAAILGLTALATFGLAYQLGTRELSRINSRWFLFLFVTSMIVNSVGLLLVGSASLFVIAVAAFSVGRKRIPLKVIAIVIICLTFLHYGKSEMRAKYWFRAEPAIVQPWQYPAWYAEWAGYSLQYFTNMSDSNLSKSEEKQSFLERSSVVQLFLLAQDQSPKPIPYLDGATYAILPQLLVPRFLDSSKIASHEGTYLLNIHYGRQTRDQTQKTTIGWGLLAESYANFGAMGCFGLAVVLGIIYGQTTKWTINAPILSDRSLLGIIMVSFAFQSEFSAGVYVAAVFQSVFTLGGIKVLLMKSYPTVKN